MTHFHPRVDHVALHRLWAFTSLQTELTLPEHVHIIDCDECRKAVRACLHADNFAVVLKELRRDTE